MSARTIRLLSLVLVATVSATNLAWGLGHELSETKEQLGLKYDVSAVVHDSGRVTVNLTIADQGKLKPLDSVQLAVPSADGSGYYDLALSLATEKTDGKLRARAHLSRDLADRAQIRLTTHTPPYDNVKRSERTWFYHSIPIAKYVRAAKASGGRKSSQKEPDAPPGAWTVGPDFKHLIFRPRPKGPSPGDWTISPDDPRPPILVVARAGAENRAVLIQLSRDKDGKTSVTIHSDEKTEQKSTVSVDEAVKVIGEMKGRGSKVLVYVTSPRGIPPGDLKKLLVAILDYPLLDLEYFGRDVPKKIRDLFPSEARFVRGKTAILPPGPGHLVQKSLAVDLPKKSPFPAGSPDEIRYLKGYAEGYADAVLGRVY